ncbi:MAG: RnfH family protein [Thauera sp.]|nr:RnfH family protein [Thauera sp.]
MKISIAYAVPGRQVLQTVDVPEDATLREAIERSGILEQLPRFDFDKQKAGIWGKVKPYDTKVAAGDRVELYHPVTIDPKSIPKKKASAE